MRSRGDSIVPEEREDAVRLLQTVVNDASAVGHHWMALSILVVQMDQHLSLAAKGNFTDDELEHIRQLKAAVDYCEPAMRYIRRRARRLDDGELGNMEAFDPARFEKDKYKQE